MIHRAGEPGQMEILYELSDLEDGTGTLRTVIECALRADPDATADDVRRIWAEATAEAAAEKAAP